MYTYKLTRRIGLLLGVGVATLVGAAVFAPAPARAADVRLLFRPPTSPNIDFVRVYIGLRSNVYDQRIDLRRVQLEAMGNVSAMEDALSRVLTEPRVYFIALTAVDTKNQESAFSNEIQLDLTRAQAPAPGPTPAPSRVPSPAPAPGPQPNRGPQVSVTVNGQAVSSAGVRVVAGQNVTFSAFASDPDGLGFPIFSDFGVNTRVPLVWDFGGAQVPNSLAMFNANPTVRYLLALGEMRRQVTAQLLVVDSLGAGTTVGIPIQVEPSPPPSVSLFVNGAPVSSGQTVSVSAGQTVALRAVASDPDGLGFMVFPGFPPVTYFWNFGGGTVLNPLEVLLPEPRVQFALAANETQRTFRVQLDVVDATGSFANRELLFAVQR